MVLQPVEYEKHPQCGCALIVIQKTIYSQYRDSLKEIIMLLCKYKGVETIEVLMMPNHVHLLVSIPPKLSISSVMGYLKGKCVNDV